MPFNFSHHDGEEATKAHLSVPTDFGSWWTKSNLRPDTADRKKTMDSAILAIPAAWGLSSIPFIARAILVRRYGRLDNARPRDRGAQTAGMPKAVRELCERLLACHHNQLETLGYFAASIGVAAAVGAPGNEIASLAGWYLRMRLGFVIAYASPQVAKGFVRSAFFMGSMACVFRIYWEAARAARLVE